MGTLRSVCTKFPHRSDTVPTTIPEPFTNCSHSRTQEQFTTVPQLSTNFPQTGALPYPKRSNVRLATDTEPFHNRSTTVPVTELFHKRSCIYRLPFLASFSALARIAARFASNAILLSLFAARIPGVLNPSFQQQGPSQCTGTHVSSSTW